MGNGRGGDRELRRARSSVGRGSGVHGDTRGWGALFEDVVVVLFSVPGLPSEDLCSVWTRLWPRSAPFSFLEELS